jgi:LmbE family N-acetylglucosaminyl deacetylase
LTLTNIGAMKEVECVVEKVKPQIIYTHSISDLNWDHRVVAEACIIASRPKPESVVEKLYFFEVPSSSDWTFSQIQPTFSPNVYEDITNVVNLKEAALNSYITETYDFPDARSVEAMITLAKYRGYQSGLNRAEAFQLVFSRDRRN